MKSKNYSDTFKERHGEPGGCVQCGSKNLWIGTFRYYCNVCHDHFELKTLKADTVIKKYNLTFWQKLSLPRLKLMWLMTDPSQRKSWHEVKKGMEKHEHSYTVPFYDRGLNFLKCDHEGCNCCMPIDEFKISGYDSKK